MPEVLVEQEIAKRAKSITICNTGPEHFGPLMRSYSRKIEIPACPKGTPYVSVVINDHTDMRVVAVDHWAEHSEKTPILITCQEIVADIMQTEKMRERGCFIPAGDKPTKAEIEGGLAARKAYLLRCVRNGDAAYSATGRIDDIPGEWKAAAEELGIDREWCKMAPAEKADCPACGHDLPRPDVAICGSCHAILDREKAIKFGLIEAPAEPKPESKGKVI